MRPIRVMTAALSRRIFAGRVNKAGDGFSGERSDVTNDVYGAIIAHFGENVATVLSVNGVPTHEITVRRLAPSEPQP